MNGYGSLSAYYDGLLPEVDYAAMADFLLAAFARYGKRCDQLLDLACGSGSLTCELAKRGVDMIGVDGSAEMLTVAREKAITFTDDPPLFLCQDMRQLDLYGTTDGAACTMDSLNHLLSTADLREVFRRLGLFIAPGGLLIFDVNTPYKHRQILGDNTFVLERDDLMCVWRNEFHAARCETVMQLDFFEKIGRDYRRTTDEVRERGYSLTTWKKLLSETGFDLLAVSDTDGNPPVPETERWVLIAVNRAIGQKNG